MFKSIFSRYLATTSLLMIISFVAMGGAQFFASSRYWVEDKRELLEENTLAAAREIAAQLTVTDDSYVLDGPQISRFLDIKATTIDAVFTITNDRGVLIYGSSNADASLHNRQLPQGVYDKLDGSTYFEVGTLGGVYPSAQYVVGQPIVVQGEYIGYVFAASSAAALGEYIAHNLRMFVLSALAILALTFIVLYIVTYRQVRPLRQMAAAARSYGAGDFTQRIPVKGNDEVAQLAESLNSMAMSLASMEGMHRSFVANVSHELKTPMTTIAGFVDGVLDGTIPAEKRDQYLRVVSNEVKRLSRLVKSMLDLSRIDNGSLKLTPTAYDLTQQVCNVLLTFEQRIEEKQIQVCDLEACPRVDVLADMDLMGQVIYNLVDNAVKFIDVGGTLTVRVMQYDDRAHVIIRNTGAGISAQEMPHIFERFYKSDKSRSLDKNGMGLGLYIVKTVINLHHGEICVRSAEGEFCEFEFWLPQQTSLTERSVGKRSKNPPLS